MIWDRWWLFVVATALICATPGPNMLHVMARAAALRSRRVVWAMAGCLTAVTGIMLLSVAGVGALLLAMPRLFGALRLAGAAYLVWLGVRAWRGAGKGATGLDPAMSTAPLSRRRLYRDGLLTGLANPKAILFAAAFFPQFVSRRAPELPQLGILLATFVVLECTCYLLYATGGRSLARWLSTPGRARAFDRFTGALFVAFGIGLVAARA